VPPKDQAVDVASPALSSDSRFEQDQGSIAIINSVEVIPRLTTKYVPYFNWDSDSHHSANEKVATLRLLYPAPDSSEEYPLLVPRVGKSDAHVANEYVPINELINTVHVVGKYLLGDELATKAVTDPGTGILRMLERARNKRDGPGFVRAVQDYNRIIEARRAVLDGIGYKKWGLPYELVTHVMDQVYNRVVAPKVDLLGNYKAFSNNVYGEVNPILVKEFIKRTNLGPDGVFVDLG
ncbi:Nucleosomal histone H3-Lys79 methylase, partial [Spiromyces aspiralis]